MIESLHQIEFITASGTRRLLDIGAIVSGAPVIAVQQSVERYSAIGADWSEAFASQGADATITWTAVREHASHATLHAFCIRHAADFPSNQTGALRLTISGGEVWEMKNTVLASSAPLPLPESGTFETITAYNAAGGEMLPVSTLTLYAGIPWKWINQSWPALTGTWSSL
jgi:hypothetical protein